MANAITSCDVAQLYAVITARIHAAFPALQTVEFDREDRDVLPVPACLLEIGEADDGQDPGSEQQCMDVRFSAQFVVGYRSLTARREVIQLAMAFAAFLRAQGRWPGIGGQGGEPRIIGCYPDEFDPQLDKYDVWRVEWHQSLWFGKSVWDWPNIPLPEHVHLGRAPDVGIGNEDKYTEVTNG